MSRGRPALPHPFADAVTQSRGKFVMSSELFGLLSDIVDLIPITGTVTFAAATTAAVTFDTPELSTDYNILIEAPENRTFWITSKTVNGFTLNVSSSSSATYGWTMTRR